MPCTPASAAPGSARSSRRCGSLPDPATARLLYVTHSVPEAMDDTSGPGDGEGNLYTDQHVRLARRLTDEVNRELGPRSPGELVFCSRSGPPTQPWLEPDVNDRIEELAAAGRRPRRRARRSASSPTTWRWSTTSTPRPQRRPRGSGCPFLRVATPGTDEVFVEGLVDLLLERAAEARGEVVVPETWLPGDVRPSVCAPGLLPQPAHREAGPVRQRLMATASALPQASTPPGSRRSPAGSRARRAGSSSRSAPTSCGVSSKSTLTDPVTVMDQRSQELLMRLLGEERPDDAVLGEEEGGAAGSSGLTWVVDPIDGTVNYLYGIPAYAVSVAVVTGDPTRPGDWQAVAGAVLNPVTGELFHAHRGGGARLTTAARHPHAAGHRRHRPRAGARRHRVRLRRADARSRQAAAARRAAAPGARHPAARESGARPVRPRGRADRRLLRDRAQRLGPRGR